MGEYFKLYNKTKNQSINPHRVGNGLKIGEWLYTGSDVLASLQSLVDSGEWARDDEYFAVSDYGSALALSVSGKCDAEVYGDDSLDVMPPGIKTTGSGWVDSDWPEGKPVFDKTILPLAGKVFSTYYKGESWED